MLCAALYGMKWMWMQEYEMKWKWNVMEMKWNECECYVLHYMEWNECECKNMKWNGNEMKWKWNECECKTLWEVWYDMCGMKWNAKNVYARIWNEMKMKMWMQDLWEIWKLCAVWNEMLMTCTVWNGMWKCECKNMKGNKNKKWMWMQDSMTNVRCYELYEMEHMKHEMAVWLMCMYEYFLLANNVFETMMPVIVCVD